MQAHVMVWKVCGSERGTIEGGRRGNDVDADVHERIESMKSLVVPEWDRTKRARWECSRAGCEADEEGKVNCDEMRLTAPPTSYSNQLTCVPLRLMSKECSLTPSVCKRTFRMSSATTR